jgi:hypothetical protein
MLYFILFLALATSANAIMSASSSPSERDQGSPNYSSITNALATYAFLLVVAFVTYCTIGR